MKWFARFLICQLALCAVCLVGCGNPPAAMPPPASADSIAAGGLVEPAGEERVVIPQLSGRLAKVYIDEGDHVEAGMLIGEIENSEYRAALAAAEAQLALRTAELDKARNGPRAEEIAVAKASLDEATAAERLAIAERERRTSMAARELISVELLQQAQAQADGASARREQALAQLALVRAGSRREDLAAADAAVGAASAERDRARALMDKSQIRAPVTGSVLKRDLREGETVVALSPLPLARIGDLSHLFVRADIDELDIARIRVGQKARVSSDAFSGQTFSGAVVRVSRRMGRRNSISGDPAEKQDAKILEALIALEGSPALPVGLRVDVRIDTREAGH
ncbi:MAG: efflux RND transporter periplasmic adaptor subunit [Tahibacter sp.]